MHDLGIGKGWHWSDVEHKKLCIDPAIEYRKKSPIGKLKMRLSMRHVVVRTHEGLKIISTHGHVKHSNEVCAAAPHFRPGDEKFIKMTARGTVLFDHHGRKAHHEKLAKSEVETWNEKSPLERFTHKLKGQK